MNNFTSSGIALFACTLLFIFLIVSCRGSSGDDIHNDADFFDKDGIPVFVKYRTGDYYISKPVNYDKPENSAKRYPLLVYLHGSGSDGDPDVLPCFNNINDKKKYPAFVYLPHTSKVWDNGKLISQIEVLKSVYRIDTDRIYLIGYSLGGSGSYSLANEYYDSKKQLFAGIVRLAGQSQTSVHNSIADKTSIWYHVGLSDTALRVQIGKESYKFLKDYPGNSAAKETLSAVAIEGYPGSTLTLTKKGVEIVKYTEYNQPTGHGINNLPFKDPYLLNWLFSQSLKKR